MIKQIGFGGGCHWCTEGVFQSLIGIVSVQQGWISSFNENESLSEAVIVEFNEELITLSDLIEIHLYTHASTSNHSFRKKYRSAVYAFDLEQKTTCEELIDKFQLDFEKKIITKVLLFNAFKLNKEEHLNYLYTKEDNPFCKTYIHPKLSLIKAKFSKVVNHEKLKKLTLD
jgi:peptide-methionine (S)-S-oxide reductase